MGSNFNHCSYDYYSFKYTYNQDLIYTEPYYHDQITNFLYVPTHHHLLHRPNLYSAIALLIDFVFHSIFAFLMDFL